METYFFWCLGNPFSKRHRLHVKACFKYVLDVVDSKHLELIISRLEPIKYGKEGRDETY